MKTLFLAASLLLVACASPAEDSSSSDSALSSSDVFPGVAVDAVWDRAVTGIPTYGYDATTPYFTITLRVVDDELRAAHPGFDGLERPFVIVTHEGGRSERLDLRYTGTGQVGYYQYHSEDEYELAPTKLTEADLELMNAKGIVFGLDTNVGTLESTIAVTQQRH